MTSRSSNPGSPTSFAATSTPDGSDSPPTTRSPPTTPRSTSSASAPPQEDRGHRADLSHVHAAVDTLVPTLRGQHVLIGKSTVPVGTCEQLSQRISLLSAPGADVELSWSPEFLREGFAVEDTLSPDRLVLGAGRLVDDPQAAPAVSLAGEVVRDIYREVLETGVP